MTTSNNATISNSHVVYHQAKFRWTENLTCRFIQLRKEHGKMFTGRKYSAQAGWEYILRQMREEFPTIMADVHYRVLKKKWSNLLQQYKELKNPVHGDKNKADDISWPFYAAIDEVLGNIALPGSAASAAAAARRHRTNSSNNEQEDNDDDDEEDLNPQEFLCVSVAPDNDDQLDLNVYEDDRLPELQSISSRRAGPVFDVDRIPRTTRRSTTTTTTSTTTISRKRNTVGEDSSNLLSRLPRATELTIRPIRRNTTTTICSSSTTSTSEVPTLSNANGSSCDIIKDFVDTKDNNQDYDEEEDERPSKCCKTENCQDYYTRENRESRLEKKIVEFFEYTKKRDEENRNILMRMLEAVEDIRKAVS